MNIQEQCLFNVSHNLAAHQASALEMKHFLDEEIKFPVPFLYIPKFYDEKTLMLFQSIVEMTHSICEKVIKAYRSDAEYRKLFSFSKQIEELILSPVLCGRLLPIARFDLFLNEDDGSFKFCEFNTDGLAGMRYMQSLELAMSKNLVFEQIARDFNISPTPSSFHALPPAFLKMYSEHSGAVEKPFIAIVDFPACLLSEKEFVAYSHEFQKMGCGSEVCDIRDLTYKNKTLFTPSGKRIDAVYRRAVTGDIEQHFSEVLPFISAVREGAVSVIGPLCTQVAHNKILFVLIREPATLSLLTDEEQHFVKEHIPLTKRLHPDYVDLEEIIRNRGDYVIKPPDAYDCFGVFAGCDCSQNEWETLVRKNAGENYLVQEYCDAHLMRNINFLTDSPKFDNYKTQMGLFSFDGHFAGILQRFSQGTVIDAKEGDMVFLPVFKYHI